MQLECFSYNTHVCVSSSTDFYNKFKVGNSTTVRCHDYYVTLRTDTGNFSMFELYNIWGKLLKGLFPSIKQCFHFSVIIYEHNECQWTTRSNKWVLSLTEESKMNAEYQWRKQVLYAPRQPQTQPNNYLRYMNKQFVQCINKIIWFVWYKLKIRKDKKYTRNTKIKCSQLKQFSIKDCWKFSKLLTAISLHREQNWRSNEKNLHWWISILYYQK